MSSVTVGPNDDLAAALKRASAGDVLTFEGTHVAGKVSGIHGVTLRGADPVSSVIVSSGVLDVGNLRVEDSDGVTLQGFTLRDATMNEARALQAFRCGELVVEDLILGPDVWLDLCHLVDCGDPTLRRRELSLPVRADRGEVDAPA